MLPEAQKGLRNQLGTPPSRAAGWRGLLGPCAQRVLATHDAANRWGPPLPLSAVVPEGKDGLEIAHPDSETGLNGCGMWVPLVGSHRPKEGDLLQSRSLRNVWWLLI